MPQNTDRITIYANKDERAAIDELLTMMDQRGDKVRSTHGASISRMIHLLVQQELARQAQEHGQ